MAGGALAATEDVRRDHEPRAAVDRRIFTDEAVPPTGRLVTRASRPDHVRIAGQCVQNKHRVGRVGVQLTHVSYATRTCCRWPPSSRSKAPRSANRLSPGWSPLSPCTGCGETTGGRHRAQASFAARKPRSRSARMSSMPSMPTASRTSPGVTPVANCSSGDNCECVVEAG